MMYGFADPEDDTILRNRLLYVAGDSPRHIERIAIAKEGELDVIAAEFQLNRRNVMRWS